MIDDSCQLSVISCQLRRLGGHAFFISHTENHDFGRLDERGGGLAGLELHFTGGARGDDGGDALATDGEHDFGHQAADLNIFDAADKLVAAADAAGSVATLGAGFAASAE